MTRKVAWLMYLSELNKRSASGESSKLSWQVFDSWRKKAKSACLVPESFEESMMRAARNGKCRTGCRNFSVK